MNAGRPPSEVSSALRLMTQPGLDPFMWEPERRGVPSAWWGHVPFAHWLVQALRPRVLVELGTHRGVSYCAFCNAVSRGGLATRCFGIDTWAGDAHSGTYNESVYCELAAFHDARYAGFSTLLRSTFGAALPQFADGSVDLLHIDGFHTYEATSHDFKTWEPKLSGRAVVLFHDIAVRDQEFGVWRLWEELGRRYPHFEFHHSYGLGVLAVGRNPAPEIAELCGLSGTEAGDKLRERIARIGERWSADPETNGLAASPFWRTVHRLHCLWARLPEAVKRAIRGVIARS